MYRIAYKVEFQPLSGWYLQLTVFRFLDSRNRLLVRNRTPRWYSGHLIVCSCDSSTVELGFGELKTQANVDY